MKTANEIARQLKKASCNCNCEIPIGGCIVDVDRIADAITQARADAFEEAAKIANAALLDAEEEIKKWKDEYENVCKFATDYEQQRDDFRKENQGLRAQVEEMRDVLSEVSDVTWEFKDHNIGYAQIALTRLHATVKEALQSNGSRVQALVEALKKFMLVGTTCNQTEFEHDLIARKALEAWEKKNEVY